MLAAEELWRRLDDPATQSMYAPYLAVLPAPTSKDEEQQEAVTPLTTTDFFTEAELGVLGCWPPIVVRRWMG